MSSKPSPIYQTGKTLTPPTGTLWWAYAFAPAVAPMVFAITVLVVGMVSYDPESTGTPIGIIMIPIAALTIGMLASYLVAGTIGMPIAFYLRRRERLNVYTIHGAAFLWTVVMVVGISLSIFLFSPQPQPPAGSFLVGTLIAVLFMSPFILLSATTFWWIVSRNIRSVSLQTLFLIMTVASILVAIVTVIFSSPWQ